MPTPTLPVSTVVLYSSGVAYFEHAGDVTGTASADLPFKTAQINDVLKSLVLQDTAGTVGAVVYPSHDPVAKTLKSFRVDLTDAPSLPTFLQGLRGAAISVSLPTETLQGTIVSLEKRARPFDPKNARGQVEIWLLTLLVADALRPLPLDDISALTLQDPALQQDLSRALAVLATARDQDKKSVTLHFTGEGTRPVRIGYVVEAPVWKSSYRLLLPPEGAPDSAHLQGWAIIENQTDNDWNNVTLTLVSGRPLSFIQELYQPTYLPRPTVQPDLYTSLQPPLFAGGVAMAAAGGASAGGAGAPPLASAMKRRSRSVGLGEVHEGTAVMDHLPESLDASASVASAADTSQLGELFQYTVGNISLPRQRAAMIPIVTDPIASERLSLFNETTLPRHPLYGIKLTNTTGKHLLQGPVTVLEASAYAGDARIDNLPPGQHRYLAYGIDLQVFVNTSTYSPRAHIMTASIAKGVLEVAEKVLSVKTYSVENKSDRPRTLLIEHPIEPGFTLVDTPAPVESTDTHHRLRYALAPGARPDLPVKSQWIRTRRLALVDELAATLDIIAHAAAIPSGVKGALEYVLRRRRDLADLDAQVATLEKQIKELTDEQSRLRKNLETAPAGNPYHNRLLAKLNEQETRFEKLQLDLETLRTTRTTTARDLSTHLSTLTITD